MKKPHSKKLVLDCETLISLQADRMDAVIGGNAGARPSLLGCETNGQGRTCLLCIPDPVQ